MGEAETKGGKKRLNKVKTIKNVMMWGAVDPFKKTCLPKKYRQILGSLTIHTDTPVWFMYTHALKGSSHSFDTCIEYVYK